MCGNHFQQIAEHLFGERVLPQPSVEGFSHKNKPSKLSWSPLRGYEAQGINHSIETTSIQLIYISVVGIHTADDVDSPPDFASLQISPVLLSFYMPALIKNSSFLVMRGEDHIRVDSQGLELCICSQNKFRGSLYCSLALEKNCGKSEGHLALPGKSQNRLGQHQIETRSSLRFVSCPIAEACRSRQQVCWACLA